MTEIKNITINNELASIDINTADEINLNIEGVNCNGSLFINIIKAKKILINTNVLNGEFNILYWNECKNNLEINEFNNVGTNAILKVAHGQLEKNDVYYQSITHINGTNAESYIKTATLCESVKKYKIDCINEVGNTLGNMENYCVCLENGLFDLEATGKIVKGARSSKNYQSSRCLTFNNPKKATIKPLLLIDENDVEASHATSVGQIDENQMYYLQSRGLTYAQATNLITIGYLLPISEFIDNLELKELLKEKIEMKVNSIC